MQSLELGRARLELDSALPVGTVWGKLLHLLDDQLGFLDSKREQSYFPLCLVQYWMLS